MSLIAVGLACLFHWTDDILSVLIPWMSGEPMFGTAVIVAISVALSLTWLGGTCYFVVSRLGTEGLLALEPMSLVQLAGTVVEPVAIIWLAGALLGLLLALRHQAFAIRQLLRQIKRTADQGGVHSRTLLEWRGQARHEAFYRTVGLALDDISATLASLALRVGLCGPTDLESLWHRHQAGDRWVFCHLFYAAAERDQTFTASLSRSVVADARLRTNLLQVLNQYERLVRLGSEHD
ncbi:MAG: Uncharacterized protein FD153_507, partial [Rhodospirillaceae bacterium]